MRLFQYRQLHEAMAHADSGGQAVHLMPGGYANLRSDTPRIFKGRREIAHLFDHNEARLIATARRLGVRVIRVERRGQPGQHIDLCGGPLEEAKRIAAKGGAL